MAQRPDLSRYLDAGTQFVALTRAQARARAAELVSQGQLAQEQVQGFVDDLVDESRRRTDEMLEVVRREIRRQVKTLGIATKDDLAKLESRIAPAKRSTSAKRSAKKPSTAKKTKKAKKTSSGTSTKQSTGKSTATKTTGKAAKQKRSTAGRAKKSSKSGA